MDPFSKVLASVPGSRFPFVGTTVLKLFLASVGGGSSGRSNLRQLRSVATLTHLMLQISFWYLSGRLRQPLGASGSLREAFSKVVAFVQEALFLFVETNGLSLFLAFVGGGSPGGQI